MCNEDGTKTEYIYNEDACGCEEVVTEIEKPETSCYEQISFDTESCEWDVSGEMPVAPEVSSCRQTTVFDEETCIRSLAGEEPVCGEMVCNADGTVETEILDVETCECVVQITQ